ncbi:Zinc finger SWIM domain-containing protein 8 [Orchesella cincta]|uniref:Zinc finger SWIM domain-containing protein 8 n=1 Tax=Orchesella cincta TaxID=48709 RepID=A0A1D2MQM0_ORCCI|nr:Zinc finger SWIM domain-containing protein 8 [Orchesella cincta]
MRDWELVDSDRFSFEDSDRFEEDSLCSWISEPESLCNNWRGWKKSTYSSNPNPVLNGTAGSGGLGASHVVGIHPVSSSSSLGNGKTSEISSFSLVEMSAKCVASHIPFEMVERVFPPVPEQLQLRIAFWSFPEHEEDIRLYSCLANGSAEEFQKGEKLFRNDSVGDILQIGFHLSATVKPNMRESHKVAVTFDRRRVTSCTCTCNASTNWCGHVVAVCLHRIFQSKDVTLRAPVSESLSRLHRDQLQKFAQYLISELPQQILPTAQRLLDELLSSQRSAINTLRGAPDPTAGASVNEQTSWYLDERTLHGNIHKILIKFCVPAPIVFSDVNYLTSAAPPASAEWSSLLRPLRGREPEGMWNLLSIVREMFRREDRNAVPLLEIITEECLNCDQILVWWFNTKVALHNGNSGHGGKHHSVNSNAHACQHAGSSLCDEIVCLWRLAALNPGLTPEERCILHSQFREWHIKIVEKVSKSRNASVVSKHANSFKNDVEVFPGFRPAIEACYLTWDSYPIPGVTFSESSRKYHCPFMCFRHSDGHSRSGDTGMIHSSHAILNNPAGEHHLLHSSATICSIPITPKRPRSVEFGVERSGGGSTEGPSRNTLAVPGRVKITLDHPPVLDLLQDHRSLENLETAELLLSEEMGSNRPVVPSGKSISASGLKIKVSRDASFEQSSFEDDAPVPSGSSSSSGNEKVSSGDGPSNNSSEAVVVLPLGGARNGNRSSVSSEGFCDNENDPDLDGDEGVEADAKVRSSASQTLSLNNTGTSDELDGDVEADLDGDSDSSLSARDPTRLVVASVVNVPAPKFDSSDSQQSGDEYQLYYYDPKAPVGPSKRGDNSAEDGKKDSAGWNVFANLRRIEDRWEILFARAEGLHAHGHSKEACKLGVKLAGELLEHPPNLSIDLPLSVVGKGKRKKVNPLSHQISCLASATLAKCSFLCTVLAENSEQFCLAFQVGMFGLELARPPASTKPLEVKLANQEAELAQLLKRILIGQKELDMIRLKAQTLKDGTFKSRGEALLPLVLANFIFDALVMPTNREGRCNLQAGVYHLPNDEALGFEAAVSALGLKANVSEADHPLLCEGTRRQRGDLALAMLLHYKDDPDKLAKIMEKLLDREIHQLYKVPLPSAYYSNSPPTTTLLGSGWNSSKGEESSTLTSPRDNASSSSQNGSGSGNTPPSPSGPNNESGSSSSSTCSSSLGAANKVESSTVNLETPSATTGTQTSNASSSATPTRSDSEDQSNSQQSAPTTSTAASGGGGSQQQASSSNNASGTTQQTSAQTTTTTTVSQPSGRTGKESVRFKGKRSYPVLPNQPSEAGAHFMFELAKIVLGKAGGSSNQSLFTQPSNGQNPRGPHRALHMCAFHIGLYALGLHNAVSPNWLSRTYSSHVSWITGQAMEIGAPAIAFLIDTWETHLTPTEAVTIADRASRGDANMVRAAAELALSCLPHAHALNPNEIHRAILQCKEQSDGMLEKACLTVESAAKGGGVYPEVLFDVARQWYSLYQKHLPLDVDVLNDELSHHDSLLSSLESGLDPLNPGAHGHQVVVSPQTGLPPVNPNNPPPPPPSGGASGPSNVQGPIDIIQIQAPPSQMGHQPQHNGSVYPMPAPHMTTIQYPGPYAQVPIFPTFNPVPGNYVYGQVIYQPNAPGGSGVSTSTASYYNNQQQPPQSQQNQVGPPPFGNPIHQQHNHHGHGHNHSHSHSMVNTGATLQYYPPVPISTASGPSNPHPHMNMRQAPTQYFPVTHSHMSVMNTQIGVNHHHGSNVVVPPCSGPQVAVVAAAPVQGHPVTVNGSIGIAGVPMAGHVQHMSNQHHHTVSMSNNSHMLAITNGTGNQNGMGQQGGQQGPMVLAPNGHHGQMPSGMPNGQILLQPNGHGMSQGNMQMMNSRQPGQPQMNCGNGMMNPGGGFLQGGHMPPPPHGNQMPPMGKVENIPVSGAQFLQGARDNGNQHQQGQSAIKMKYLLAAYRVGMLAMETLARRVHDDRPQAKFARNPPYGEDVKWLLSISRKLGAQYLQQFCICAVSSIANPFVLHEIILDAALISRNNNLSWVYTNPRSPLAPLVQKCQQMYFQCLHQKLYHITLADYEDFVSIVCTARQAFHLTPDGVSQFKEWLQNLRRSKACKKDLWTQITAALQSNPK